MPEERAEINTIKDEKPALHGSALMQFSRKVEERLRFMDEIETCIQEYGPSLNKLHLQSNPYLKIG